MCLWYSTRLDAFFSKNDISKFQHKKYPSDSFFQLRGFFLGLKCRTFIRQYATIFYSIPATMALFMRTPTYNKYNFGHTLGEFKPAHKAITNARKSTTFLYKLSTINTVSTLSKISFLKISTYLDKHSQILKKI